MSRAWSWRQAIWESNLSATTKIVLQALASHMNDFGDPMFPSQERLSKLCSLSERAVITHLQVAEEMGWIRPRKRELRGKKWAANEYVACWPDGVNDVPQRGEGRSPDGVKEVHPNTPSLTVQENTPPTPKGEVTDLDIAFEEIWLARWGRGEGTQPRKPAFHAYQKALKRGAKHEAILAAVKARTGVEKPGTVFACMLATWLNEERWKDGQGKEGGVSPEELEASRKRAEDARKAHEERMRELTERRRRELGLTA